jgi:hypothetical protein
VVGGWDGWQGKVKRKDYQGCANTSNSSGKEGGNWGEADRVKAVTKAKRRTLGQQMPVRYGSNCGGGV